VEGKNREPVASLTLYHLLKWSVVSPVLHTYFRAKIYGAKKVPMTGGLIAVSNHASYFDPPILSNCVGRPVAFMAKEELFKIPVFKSDRTALRATATAIESGWVAAVFLQGTRAEDARITNPKRGAAWIAAQAQVPLLPISLWGTEKILQGSAFPRPVPITVRIGDVIAPPASTNKDDLQLTTKECARVINSLHDLGR